MRLILKPLKTIASRTKSCVLVIFRLSVLVITKLSVLVKSIGRVRELGFVSRAGDVKYEEQWTLKLVSRAPDCSSTTAPPLHTHTPILPP